MIYHLLCRETSCTDFRNILCCLPTPPRPPTCSLPTCILILNHLPTSYLTPSGLLNSFLTLSPASCPTCGSNSQTSLFKSLPQPYLAVLATCQTAQDLLLAPGCLIDPVCLLIPAPAPDSAPNILGQKTSVLQSQTQTSYKNSACSSPLPGTAWHPYCICTASTPLINTKLDPSLISLAVLSTSGRDITVDGN